MNKQLFNLFLTSLAKKPKLADWEIRETHLRNNLGVKGKRKGGQKGKGNNQPSLPSSAQPAALASAPVQEEQESRRRRKSSIEDILPGALLAFAGRRKKNAKSPGRPESPLPATHTLKSVWNPKGITSKFSRKRNDKSLIIQAEKYSNDIFHPVHLYNNINFKSYNNERYQQKNYKSYNNKNVTTIKLQYYNKKLKSYNN